MTAAVTTVSAHRMGASLLALAFVTGVVDTLSFLGFGDVFTSNMTGNVVLLGVSFAEGTGPTTLRSLLAFAAFLAGLAAGFALADHVFRRRRRWILLIESVLIAALSVAWMLGAPVDAMTAVAAVAMGMQSAVVERSGAGVSVNYVTSVLAGMLGHLTLLNRPDAALALKAGIILSLAAGAACTTAVLQAAPMWAADLAFPAILLALIVFPNAE
ncbi:DUF1275 family protein [Nocardiopsis baichengensis]|uniref:DUF1275 family protein n=1 Tax=Nocardiopsis baichengensis TaxID=280240 RepID=UPI00034D25C7|nr:YoaK family protein [Nocardiopsis baichengensis]